MASKYVYKGIPLDKYCEEHGLNKDTQRRRVQAYLRKHPNTSLDDATKIVMDRRDRVIYKYGEDGKSLADYCREHDILYDTMVRRIKSIKKKKPEISNDEATRIAIEEFNDSRLKYFYEGKTLEEYCEEHGLNADTQRNRIKDYSDEHPDIALDEVIKTVLSTCGRISYKYGYEGRSLADYCREYDIPYSKMISRVDSIKKQKTSILDDEATRIAIEEFNDKGIKYFYGGMPLVVYCQLHPEYNYFSILTYIYRKLENNPDVDIQEVINSYFLVEHKTHTYHFVDGIPLYEYCEQNGIVYNSIIHSLSRMRKNPKYSSLTEQERLKIAIENYQSYVGCYLYYKGISLFEYCRKNDYSYNSVYNYIFSLVKDNHSITLEEAMEIAFTNIKRYGIKYYYKGEPLIYYCRKVGLDEKNVRARIVDRVNHLNMTMEEAIEDAISYYSRKKYYDDRRRVFRYLKEQENIPESKLKEILEFLNIDAENVKKVAKFYNNLSDAVNIIWYFHDNEDGKKLSISTERLKEVLQQVKELENIDISKVCEIDILFLIGVYKSSLFDTRYLILLHQERYLLSRIRTYARAYNLSVSEDFVWELKGNLDLRLLECIDYLTNNNQGMVISYINKSIDGYLKTYFIQHQFELARVISLDKPIEVHPNSKNKRVLLDTIAAKEEDDSDEFGDEMVSMIDELGELEKKYILYKFQYCLSDEEIGTIFGMDLEELELFSKSVLSRLRNNEKIKKYASKKNS